MVKHETLTGKKQSELTHTFNHVNYPINKHNLKQSTIFYLKNQQKFSFLVRTHSVGDSVWCAVLVDDQQCIGKSHWHYAEIISLCSYYFDLIILLELS